MRPAAAALAAAASSYNFEELCIMLGLLAEGGLTLAESRSAPGLFEVATAAAAAAAATATAAEAEVELFSSIGKS